MSLSVSFVLSPRPTMASECTGHLAILQIFVLGFPVPAHRRRKADRDRRLPAWQIGGFAFDLLGEEHLAGNGGSVSASPRSGVREFIVVSGRFALLCCLV